MAGASEQAEDGDGLKIGIIGSGEIGTTVGKLLADAGHNIRFGVRRAEDGKAVAGRAAGTIEESLAFGDVVLCAVPFGAWLELAKRIAGAAQGKIIVDAANPNLKRDGEIARAALELPGGAGEMVSKLLPGARLVRPFSTIQAEVLAKGAPADGPRLGLPVAGNDADAVAVASQLVWDAGFSPVVVGSLQEARRFDSDTEVFDSGLTGPELAAALGVR